MKMDENDWIEKVLQGDAAAFENLVGKYQARLVAFLWNLLGSGEDARDAAQDAFIQAYVKLGQFDRSRSFRSWLFAIAYNRGIDLLRKKRNFRRFWMRETASGDPLAADSAASAIADSPFWRSLLRRVTPQERSVLALKYNEGCGSEEIASTLGCSESTVRVHLLNARRKLKKELHAAGYDVGPTQPNAEEVP
jgi:RNA polymerase sigma-70 factor (ECF subfamily)